MRGLFITGTDTGVGKTHIASAIVRELREAGHRVGAFKPACSGVTIDDNQHARWDDVDRLREALGRNISDDSICPQRFLAPLAPPAAADREGRTVDLAEIERGLDSWRANCDILVVEGAGGLLCPLTQTRSMADLASQIGFPLVIVARLGLGTINHTLLTVEVAQHRGLRIAGIVFNEPIARSNADISVVNNPAVLAVRCNVPILAIRNYQADGWVSRFDQPTQLDWWTLAGIS